MWHNLRVLKMDELVEIGFERVGRWQLSDSGLDLSLDRMADVFPALYAFLVEGQIKYIGKTVQPLG